MSKNPCKDCISFPVCRNKAKQMIKNNPYLHVYEFCNHNCELLKTYLTSGDNKDFYIRCRIIQEYYKIFL